MISSPADLATGPNPVTPRWALVALLAIFLLAALRIAWLCDDAFITFRTVDNFVNGFGLTWNTDERVQAYTHPLWMLLVSAVYAFTHEIFVTAIAVSMVAATAAVSIVLFRLAGDPVRALAFVAMMVLSQALLEFSTSGLENPLSFLLIAVFVAVWQAPVASPRQLFWLFAIGGLAALNRQDLVLLVFPALALTLWQERSWRALRTASLALLPLLLWELFSLLYYGFPFPNTYYAKLNTGIPSSEYFAQGLIYLEDTLTHDPATILIIVLGIATGLRARHWPLAIGMALYVYYVVSVGGDFMQGRSLSVPAFLGAILLVRHPATFGVSTFARFPAAAALTVLAIMANGLIVTRYDEGLNPFEMKFRRNGVADERQFYVGFGQSLSRMQRNFDLPSDLPWARSAAAWRGDGSPRVEMVDVAGVAGFVAGPQVHLVDVWALSEPLLARLPIAGPWRIGHFTRAMPPGLFDSYRTGENRLADPGLATLHEQLDLVVRGPLWSWQRFKAIYAFNTSGYRAWLKGYLAPVATPLQQLADPKPTGYPWNGPGTVTMTANGLDVGLGAKHQESRLSLSLDNNDDYRFDFLDGAKVVGTVRLRHGNSGEGLLRWWIDVPAGAVKSGYDHIVISPSNGDGSYSIGHLVLENAPSVARPAGS